MMRTIVAVTSFALAFGVGELSISLVNTMIPATEPTVSPLECESASTGPAPAPIRATPTSDVEFAELEAFEINFPEATDLVDILQTDTYRESEVIAKNGEKWLTLFERNGRYFLEPAKARVKKKRTQSYAGDEYDVQLSFDKAGLPLFAVRSKLGMKAGPVTTLYRRPSDEEIERRNLPIGPMETGFRQDFRLNENWYTLRVSRGMDRDGKLLAALVLEDDKLQQVVATNIAESDSAIVGPLFWVGDLDGDNKLDLYFDEFNEKGYFSVGLYLSSFAQDGELVKLVAVFGTAGC